MTMRPILHSLLHHFDLATSATCLSMALVKSLSQVETCSIGRSEPSAEGGSAWDCWECELTAGPMRCAGP